jgi:two-component system cell cycle response regulator
MASLLARLLAPDRRLRVRTRVVVGLAGLAAAWLVDAAVHSGLFGGQFVRELLHPTAAEIWMRVLVAILLVLLEVVVSDRARLRLLVAERRRSDEELRGYAHRLEEANRLKELFADILRHDLLGPVATLRLAIDMLPTPEDDARAKRALERARRSCTRLTEMIESAAKYAKVSALREIEFGRVDLGAVLADVVAQSEPLAEARGARIAFANGKSCPARAHPMIADVFANLLSNAVKYGPPDGTVAIEMEDVGDRWRVSVADRGDGIPDADKARLFTRFERLAKEGVKGTGLGLAIAKLIIEMHGGAISLEDNPGGGAVFRVTLPKA